MVSPSHKLKLADEIIKELELAIPKTWMTAKLVNLIENYKQSASRA